MIGQRRGTYTWWMLATGLAVGLAAAAQAKEVPATLKVGQTARLTLGKNESRDYLISLSKGYYWIIWDGQRTDGRSSNLIGRVQLLKNNGVIVDPMLLVWNEIGISARTGKRFHVARPLPARIRVDNQEAETEIWLTVVPAQQLKFLPFGFGASVQPARISSEEGAGGTLEKHGTAYHRITLPPGRWSISLGLVRPDGRESNVMGRVDLLNAYGLTQTPQFIVVNEIGKQARNETVLSIARAQPVMFRVSNSDGSSEVNYDLTIQKATD